MNKRKNRCRKALCFFLMALLLFLESAPMLTAYADANSFVLTVTPEAVYDNGNAKAEDGEFIKLKLTLDQAPGIGNFVSVSYKTYNETGDNAEGSDDIANYGDYAQTYGTTVSFSAGQTEQTVTIKVHNRNANITRDGNLVDRTFHFAVTSATAARGSVAVNGGNVRCQVTKAILVDVSPAEKYSNGNAKSTDGNAIAVNITLDKLPKTGNSVTVGYHTESYGGAVGSEEDTTNADYKITKGKSVFTTEKSQSVFIPINPDNEGVLVGGVEINRTFRFVIDKISASSAEEEVALHTSSVTCQLPSSILFEATQDSKHPEAYYFTEYANPYGEYNSGLIEVEDEHSDSRYNIFSDKLGTYQNWKQKFINRGLAKAYLSINELVIKDPYDCTQYTQTTVSYANQGDYVFFLETNGPPNPDSSRLRIISTDICKIPSYPRMYFQETYMHGDGPTITQIRLKSYIWGNVHTSFGSDYDGWGRTLFEVPDEYDPVYNVKFDNQWSGVINRYFSIKLQVFLVDATAPQVFGVYADDSTVYIDNKFRVSVRFTEPVQVFNSNISITVKIGTTDVEMKYLSGSGCDTLTFECDFSDTQKASLKGRYKSATLESINGADKIGDFAHYSKYFTYENCNSIQFCNHLSDDFGRSSIAKYGESSEVSDIGNFDIDFRTPSVSINNAAVTPNVETVASSRRFPVTVNDVTSGTFYYGFGDSLTAEPVYTQSKEIDNPDGDPTTVYVTGENLEGEKYLFVKVVSSLGKMSETVLYKDEDTMESDKHGYYFSNIPPTVSDIATGGTENQTRFFEFDIKTDYLTDSIGSEIYALYLVRAEDRYGTQAQSYCIYASEGNTDAKVMAQSEYFTRVVSDASFGNPKEGKHFYLELSGLSSIIGLENKAGKSAGTFYLGFYAIDSAGNSSYSTLTFNPYRFDLSPTFKAEVEYFGTSVTTGMHLSTSKVYHASDRAFDLSDCAITFSLHDLAEASLYVDSVRAGNTYYYFAPTEETAAAWTQESQEEAIAEAAALEAQGKDTSSVKAITYAYWKDGIASLFSVSENTVADPSDATQRYNYLNVSAKSASYYEIVLGRWDGGRKTSADTYSFYVTNKKKEETTNYALTDGNFVLSNRLYFLNSFFWYMTTDGTFLSENYGGSAEAPAFGTSDAARDYVRTMEQKDLYLVKLTEQQALFLNHPEETNSLLPADGESTVAEEGQWWIRYKRAEWTEPSEESGTTAASNWVYYYYCESGDNPEGIIGKLPTLVSDAIDAVANIVVKAGSYQNLVGEEYLDDVTGEPYVAPSRIHAEPELLSETKMGNRISPAASYNGDQYAYANTVSVKGVTYPLAANLHVTVNEQTALFLKNENGKYTEIALKNKATLRDLIKGKTESQVVTLLELDVTGAREYLVYIDTEAPNLLVDYVNITTDTKISTKLSAVNDGFNVTGKSIILRGFENEVDDLAYAVVYDVNTYSIVKVLYASDFAGGYRLPDGSYLIEVGDRSGNIYDLSAMICSVPLSVSVEKNEDETALLIYCNRDETEIRRYEIKLNGEIVSTSYAKAASFNQNGVYRIDIVDMFGNSYSDTVVFRRGEPKITWYYSETIDSDTILYGGEDDNGHMMVQTMLDTGVLQVTTSAYPIFIVGSDVVVNITGAEKGTDYLVGQGLNNSQYVFVTQKGFVFEAYVPGYETSAAQVVVIMETEAPSYSVSCRSSSYSPGEIAVNYPYTVNDDGTIVPASLPYKAEIENDAPVSNNSIVISDYIRMKISDISEITSVVVTYNGVVQKQVERDGSYYIFREHGDYKITATDFFGNTSSFSFTSTETTVSEYTIDGNAVNAHIDATTYGHGDAVLKMNEDGIVYLLISYQEGGQTKSDVYVYRVDSEQVGKNTYRYVKRRFYVASDASTSEYTRVFLSLSSDSRDLPILTCLLSDPERDLQAPVILSDSDLPYILAVTEDASGAIFFTVKRTDGEIRIESRVTVSNSHIEPYANDTYLSGERSDVTLVSENGIVETYKDGTLIGTVKTKEVFTVLEPNAGSIISGIYYAFSKTLDFNEYIPITFGENGCSFSATSSGFYRIRVINRYGNVTEYTLHRSDSFALVIEAVYADNASSKYAEEYQDTFRSNNKILLRAFGGDDGAVSYFLIEGNEEISLSPKVNATTDGWYTLEISEFGDYQIVLRDEFGVEKRIALSIQAPSDPDIDSLVTGFPEGAEVGSKEGYSKDALLVDFDLAAERYISYVALVYNGEMTVLKDTLTVSNGQIRVDKDSPCIGLSGDGTYTVIFRDRYGNRADYTVYYHGTDTFYAERTTRSSGEAEYVSVARIETEGGLFSNNSFTLKTLAERYTLRVNGKSSECPASFSLSTVSGDYRSEYTVTYTDHYGYSYSFSAYLIRRNLALSLSESVKVKTIDNVDKTSDVISVIFEQETVCKTSVVYTLNGGDPQPYTVGKKLYEDGTYTFVISDYAGNETYLAVKRDTVCEYTLTEEGATKPLLNYGVASGSVRFERKNGDDVEILKAYHNGELIDDIEGYLMSAGGKWELILQDGIGNTSLFTFTIVTHALVRFEYVTPYDYEITALWQELGEGDGRISRLSYLNQVDNDTYEGRSAISIADNGKYSVIMKSVYTGEVVTFSFEIDDTPPDAVLVGCNDGETTTETISLAGCRVGDRIQVYRNGSSEPKYDFVLSYDSEVPEITEGGDYVIVITNEAGASVTHTFYKKTIANTPGSLFIILMIVMLAVGLFVGLLLRNTSKVDK